MDGKSLKYKVENILNESDSSVFIDDRTTYDLLWEAAIEFNRRTKWLTGYQDITTVADQVQYALDAEFMGLHLKDKHNRYYARYYDTSNYTFITFKDYEDVIYANKIAAADAVDVPSHFSIRDKPDLYAQITGTATSAGADSAGECTLTDISGVFTTTDYVEPGDIIHNTTDTSVGVVLSITDATHLVCALFGGTDNDWTSSDAYVIQPQGRVEFILDPPPDDADDTVRVWFIKRPMPVYSDYGAYRFQSQHSDTLVLYAAWLYKYRDEEPDFGDKFYLHFDRQTRMAAQVINQGRRRSGFRVNLKKRR